MVTVNCKTCVNTSCIIYKNLEPDWIKDYVKYQIPFKQDQNIITEGSPVLGIYFILKGKVKVFFSGLNGKQQIVRFATEGHILGHKGFDNDVYPLSAIAMDDTVVCFIENATLEKMFTSSPKFTFDVMMFYSRELRKMENRMKNIAQMNVKEKVAESLILLYDNFGVNDKNELDVTFSRDDLAYTAGTNVEQVTRQLTEFDTSGLISKSGKKIVINDPGKLRAFLTSYNQPVIIK